MSDSDVYFLFLCRELDSTHPESTLCAGFSFVATVVIIVHKNWIRRRNIDALSL